MTGILHRKLFLLGFPLLVAACGSGSDYAIYPTNLTDSSEVMIDQGRGDALPDGSNRTLPRLAPVQNFPEQGDEGARPAIARPTFGNVASVRDYVLKYPSGAFVQDARAEFERMDALAWQNAQEQNDLEAYKSYISEFYDGSNVSLARQRIATLDDRATSAECEAFKSSDFGSDATPGSFLAKMRDDRQRDVCGV
ncbi:hypothetical protein [Pseudosulfitobacter pseudonitzschiae]|uniref:hypothetical protein n=1 Tax=Pseudosulfitobacter pseudonitzschiae TaxID=1402135 RepID=UPI003B81497C